MEIHKLSSEQLALIPLVRNEWLKIGLDTAPVDRAKVLEIIGRLYALANKPAPKHIIHLASPLQISNAVSALSNEGKKRRRRAGGRVIVPVHKKVRSQFTDRISKLVASPVKEQVRQFMNARNGGGNAALDFSATEFAPLEWVSDQVTGQVAVLRGSFTTFQVSEQILEQLRHPSHELIPPLTARLFRDDFGQLDASLSWFEFIGRLGIDVSKLAPTFDLAKACGWAVLFWDWAFISARPECIHLDERGRLHCETGAAIRYPDGFSIFALHGVRVPERVVVTPETITVSEIESEGNAEVRRVMIERYGLERFLRGSEAKEIHRDDFGGQVYKGCYTSTEVSSGFVGHEKLRARKADDGPPSVDFVVRVVLFPMSLDYVVMPLTDKQ